MGSSKHERNIFQLQISPRTIPKRANEHVRRLSEILDILHTFYARRAAIAYLDSDGDISAEPDPEAAGLDKRNAIYIADWDRNYRGKFEAILLHRGDPNAPNPSLVTVEDRTASTVAVGVDQAPGRSAHLLIEKKPTKVGYTRATYEEATGVSRGLFIGLVNLLLREEAEGNADYEFYVTKGKKKEKQHYQDAITIFRPQAKT